MSSQLIGSYKVMLDSKNRFNLPSPFRKYFSSLGENSEEITLRRAVNKTDNVKFIQVFPRAFYEKRITLMFKDLDPFDPEVEEKRRDISANSFPSEIKHNRILIPQNFIEHAELSGQIWVVGMFDYFEVWNKTEGGRRFTSL